LEMMGFKHWLHEGGVAIHSLKKKNDATYARRQHKTTTKRQAAWGWSHFPKLAG